MLFRSRTSEKISSYEEQKNINNNKYNLKANLLIKEITQCIEKFHINVAIAKLYIFLSLINEALDSKDIHLNEIKNIFKNYLIVTSIFIPYVTNECWYKISGNNTLSTQNWPTINDDVLTKNSCDIVIQINGKKRAIINVATNETEENILSKSLAIKNIKVILDKKIIKNKIFIKNKLLNIVTNEN